MRISDWSSDVCSSDLTRSKAEPMPLPENFNELVRNLPKPAQPPRDTGSKGRDPNRQRQDAHRQRDGGQPRGERGPRRDGAPAGEGGSSRTSTALPSTNGMSAISPPARQASPRWRLSSARSEEHTSELQSLMRISYADICLKKKKKHKTIKLNPLTL